MKKKEADYYMWFYSIDNGIELFLKINNPMPVKSLIPQSFDKTTIGQRDPKT
jgi:hypothetical protein